MKNNKSFKRNQKTKETLCTVKKLKACKLLTSIAAQNLLLKQNSTIGTFSC